MIQWRWKYFTRDELACKGSNEFLVNEDALDKLERMRIKVGKPLKINSAYRSKTYNKKVGGAPNSMHTQGRAFDVSIKGHNPSSIYNAAKAAGFTGFGFYRTFLHVDTGKPRSWGGYASLYANDDNKPPKALLIEKEQEKPNKIEGVPLSDNQAKVAVAATGAVSAGGITAVITDPTIISHGLSFLQAVDWRVAIAVVIVAVVAMLWIRGRR